MGLLENPLIILLLIATSAFFAPEAIAPSTMTPRESIVWLEHQDSEDRVRAEIIEQFKAMREDFALITNEYRLITLNDVASTLMGNVLHAGFKFELIDIDKHKIDPLRVTRLPT